jgi:hypothetical protein
MTTRTGAISFLLAVAGIALSILAGGCVSEKAVGQKETLLAAAGFRVVTALTSEQRWLIGSLPTDRISVITRMGKVYLVYPDPARHILYVGHETEYLDYERRARAQGLESAAWESAWGDWDAK